MTSILLGACATTDAQSEDGPVSKSEQMLQCYDCEDPPDEPPEEPPPPPPPPSACGNNVYINPLSPSPWPTDLSQRFRETHDYAVEKTGYPMAFPNFHAAVYPGLGEVRGTFLIKPSAFAGWQDVPNSQLGNPGIDDIPGMMRGAHSWATSQGYAAGLPTFHHVVVNGQQVRGVTYYTSSAVVFRDVPGCELGDPSLEDVGQMFRGASNYASRNGFLAAYPTFHRGYDASLKSYIYGLILFRPGMADWADVTYADLVKTCGGPGQAPCYGYCDTNFTKWSDYKCHYGYEPPPPHRGGENEPCRSGGGCDEGLICTSNGLGSDAFCYRPVSNQTSSTVVGMAQASGSNIRYENSNVANPVLSQTQAIIVSVKNTSGYALQLRHGNLNGTVAIINLAADESTSGFAGMTVSGAWSADIGNVTLGPPGISVTVDYRMP